MHETRWRNKECEAAVVECVNLVLTADQHMNTAKLSVLSPTSSVHKFDALFDTHMPVAVNLI
jgi:acyl transferase domain-containing protein